MSGPNGNDRCRAKESNLASNEAAGLQPAMRPSAHDMCPEGTVRGSTDPLCDSRAETLRRLSSLPSWTYGRPWGPQRKLEGSNPYGPKAITVFKTDKHADLASFRARGTSTSADADTSTFEKVPRRVHCGCLAEVFRPGLTLPVLSGWTAMQQAEGTGDDPARACASPL